MSIQSTSVPSVTAELLQSNKRVDCLSLKKPTRATNYKKILVRSSIFVRDLLLLLKLNCDQLDRIGGLRSNRGNKQEPDTKLTWMNNWNDIGVERCSEDETRFCYFRQHSCANFQSVTLEKVYPSWAIKKQRSSWFMNPTRNLYPWLVFTVTIKLVYSVMARPSILSTCVLAEQIIHCRKNNMRTQHVQKNPTLPDRKEDSRNILCAFQNAVLG